MVLDFIINIILLMGIIGLFNLTRYVLKIRKIIKMHKDNPNIQLQHIKLLVKKGEYAKALRICNCLKFQDTYLIQYERAKILYDLKRYDEALQIISKTIFLNSDEANKLKENTLCLDL